MDFLYTREKMSQVASILATSTGTAQDRVYEAQDLIRIRLSKEDFPESLGKEYEAILKDFDPYRTLWKDARNPLKVGKTMRSTTARKFLERLYELHLDLEFEFRPRV